MGSRRDVANTLKGASLGSSRGDATDEDLANGYFDAGPDGNYEGSLQADESYEFGPGGKMRVYKGGTLHAGQIEPDGYRETHNGEVEDEYGFVRRPRRGNDIERT